MSKYSQTNTHILAAHRSLTHPGIFVGTGSNEVSVATKLFAGINIYHANIETTANAEGVRYAIQASHKDSADNDWMTIAEFRSTTTASDNETLSGTEAVGSKVLNVALTAGFDAGTYVYIQDAGTVADSEWRFLENVVTDTSLDIVDGLTKAKDSSDVVFDEAQQFHAKLDLSVYKRVRAYVWHRTATGSNIHFKIEMITADSIG